MRYAPAAAALALALAITASTGIAADRQPAPRAAALIAQGKSALAAGDTQAAIDALEAALALDPGYTPILVELGRVAQANELPGKAIGYYREAQLRDPRSFAAIAGEGRALAQKGAMDKARGTLARLESLCGKTCPEAKSVAASIAAGPSKKIMTAEVVLPEAPAAQVN